ncbi:MAG: methylmalonyl-CoA epimerase [Bryobacterales bacterium]
MTDAAKIHHLGIAVESIDKALAFYEGALGLKAEHRSTVETEGVNVAMLPTGESRIELLEPCRPDSPIARFLDKRGEGLHHVALCVPDLDAAIERLLAQGARLIHEEARIGAEGYRYLFVHPKSAGGVLLELIEEEE